MESVDIFQGLISLTSYPDYCRKNTDYCKASEEGLRAYMDECKEPSKPNPNNKAKGVLMEDCNM